MVFIHQPKPGLGADTQIQHRYRNKISAPRGLQYSREGKTCSHDAVKPRFPVKVQDPSAGTNSRGEWPWDRGEGRQESLAKPPFGDR